LRGEAGRLDFETEARDVLLRLGFLPFHVPLIPLLN
jgi:hypothetical protein